MQQWTNVEILSPSSGAWAPGQVGLAGEQGDRLAAAEVADADHAALTCVRVPSHWLFTPQTVPRTVAALYCPRAVNFP